MTNAIVYSSQTGNTKLLAETVREALPDCLYFGPPSREALKADRIYVGFWTDKGRCDADTAAFLQTVTNQNVFLFGTAGFGGEQKYYDKILKRSRRCLGRAPHIIGTFLCQGKMPVSVRERYEKMQEKPIHIPNLRGMMENFDRALSHPDAEDLAALKASIRESLI